MEKHITVPVSKGETTSNETIKWWFRRNKGLSENDTTKVDLKDIIAMTSDDKTKGKCHIEYLSACAAQRALGFSDFKIMKREELTK